MRPSIVVVRTEDRVIGVGNQLPWKQSDDLKHFKRLTTGHHVIMGRKTLESIVKPLPNRTNIVVSRSGHHFPEGVLIARNVDEALEMSRSDDEPMVIGGEQIYELFLPYVHRIFETVLHVELGEGDAYFPEIGEAKWRVASESERHPADARNDYPYTFRVLQRISFS
jgi:dihydrofolate reductase